MKYHTLFTEFIEKNRGLLERAIFDWPIYTEKDKNNSARIVKSFDRYLRRLIKHPDINYELLEQSITQAEEYTKRILLFRFLSVSEAVIT